MSEVKQNLKRDKTGSERYQIQLKVDANIKPTLKGSFLGGVPFVPKSLDFARNKKGQVLPLMCQINFAEMPAIPGYPTEGLFQLFVTEGPDCIFDDFVGDDVVIRFLKVEQLLEEQHDMSEYDTNKRPWLFSWTQELPVKTLVGTKKDYHVKSADTIGGKPSFIQARAYKFLENFIQFRSTQENGLMIGDCGIMHLFLREKEIDELNFEKAVFFFDCG
ncbi:Conserved_hypothetical protein [Hexamita inflata]|uniref:DUF1963 domain-containing protein n=1 Tax=Hexamita inflata TaxID=28002 RepID=A0AA86TRM7_9EUKA|nr:Conserved hypothetical protein [Hexamita inflata]